MLKVVCNSRRILSVFALVFSASLALCAGGAAFADPVDYTVTVQPSLNITLSANNVVLDLNPNTKTSDAKDLGITVKTNNLTGYKLNMSSTGDATDLVRDNTVDGKNATIPTLSAAAGTTASSLSDNTWGYRVNNTGNFIPYVSGVELIENLDSTNEDDITLSLAAKINYNQAAGSYSNTLNLTATANPLVDYMQNFTMDQCRSLASSGAYTVVDKRDRKEYNVRYINGQCWMVDNLLFEGATLSPTDSDVTTTRNLNATGTYTGYSLKDDASSASSNCYGTYNTSTPTSSTGNGYVNACMYYTDNDINIGGKPNAWYNYAAATAGTIANAASTTTNIEATESICPKGWELPGDTQAAAIVAAIGSTPTSFNAAVNGRYVNGVLTEYTESTYWWTATAQDGQLRRYLGYRATASLFNNRSYRYNGFNVRCVLRANKTMQSFTASDVASMATNETKILKDARDNKEYVVTKLGDGNVWMTQNLRFTGTSLDSTTSNVASTYTPSTPLNITYTDLQGGSNSYDNAMIHDSGNSTYGVYYNYAAASAKTITGSSNTNAQVYDVCPKGWRLPTNTEQANITSNVSAFIPVVGGYYASGSINQSTTDGYWWSATSYDATIRRTLAYNSSSNALASNSYYYRYGGRYIRCIKDQYTMQSFTAANASAMAAGERMQLKDARDNKKYTVAKLADGKVWMTSNLNLAGGTVLSNDLSDVPSANYYTLPASSASGFTTTLGVYNAYVYNTGNETNIQTSSENNSYYSWLAATVGGKNASGNAVAGDGEDAAYSICPKGWKLPKSGAQSDAGATSTTGYKKGDIYKLGTAYGINLESSFRDNSAAFYNALGPGTFPNFLLAGRYQDSGFAYGGVAGNYWASSFGDNTGTAYSLSFANSTFSSASLPNNNCGFPVRCIFGN